MELMTILWSIIGVVFTIWQGAIMTFSANGALAPYIKGAGRRKEAKRSV